MKKCPEAGLSTIQYEWYRYDTLLTLPDPSGRTGAIPSYPTCCTYVGARMTDGPSTE